MHRRSQVDIWALSDLCTPWCVHVVATLRIADHIATGITQIDDLAAASGSDSLHRVMRHIVGKGVFEEPAPGRFALNPPVHQHPNYLHGRFFAAEYPRSGRVPGLGEPSDPRGCPKASILPEGPK